MRPEPPDVDRVTKRSGVAPPRCSRAAPRPMNVASDDTNDDPIPQGDYAQVIDVNDGRIAYVSGQIPLRSDGSVPADFGDQARLAWRHVEAQLKVASMTLDNIVEYTTFLHDQCFVEENEDVRRTVLGASSAAQTVIIKKMPGQRWFLEIEAMAVV